MDFSTIAAASNQDQSQADRAGSKIASDFAGFMTLLTTQLQNQDPMDPMDSAEFTNQLVQFAGVEQQIVGNKNLEDLNKLTQLSNIAGAASYLSREAVIASDIATLDGGDAVWDYRISSAIDDVTLKVYDAGGTLVYQQPGQAKLGQHEFVWTGVAVDGSQLTEGAFRLEVEANDGDGEPLNIPTFVTDRIVTIDTRGQIPIFQVGANDVSQSDIIALSIGAKNLDE